MTHVVSVVARPDKELVERFRSLGTATVHEALGRRGAMDPSIKSIRDGMKVCGPAVTVRCPPGDNTMLLLAIDIAQPGDVIVADMGMRDEGPWGELTSTAASVRGIAGLVMNASTRDTAKIAEMGFPVFCAGRCVRGTVKKALGAINHPIVSGGVAVRPGDIVVGDDDGVVVVPAEEAEEALRAALAREEKEASMRERILRGESLFDLLGLRSVLEREGCQIR